MPDKVKAGVKAKGLFVECKDEPGAGAAVLGALYLARINLDGMIGYGVRPGYAYVHVFAKDFAKAKKALAKAGFAVRTSEVLLLNLANKPGALAGNLEKIAAAGVSVKYAFAVGCGRGGAAVLYFGDPGALATAVKAVNAKAKK
jgi:hypothetical protein